MRYGKIKNGIIEIMSLVPQDGFISLPENACSGMTWNGKILSNPEVSSEEKLDQCKENLAEKRWHKTEQGLFIDGVLVQSDLVSKNEMSGYVTESITNGMTEVHWKLSDRTFVTYQIAQLKRVYQIIAKYRNDCFGVEKLKAEEIKAAEDPESIDIESGWPSNTFTTS
jgi:hypothetical protein